MADKTLQIILSSKDLTASGLGGLSKSLGDLGRKAEQVGSTLSLRLTAPIVGIGTAAVKTAADFEREFKLIEAVAGVTGDELLQLRDFALEMGAKTVFSASEAAGAMFELSKAGVDAAGQYQMLPAVMDLAAAGQLELAESANLVTAAVQTYGLSFEDATRVVDNFVAVANISTADVRDLGEALSNVGPLAKVMGFSIEDVNIALGILADRGIRGADAGTALKSMMLNLQRPTEDVTATLEMLGLSLFDAAGNMKSLPTILSEMQAALYEGAGAAGELTQQQRLLAMETLAGSYGIKAFSSLLEAGRGAWASYTEGVAGAASAQEVGRAVMETFHGAVETLKGALETLLINVGTPLINDFLAPLALKLADAVAGFSELDPQVVKMVAVFAGLLAAIGPVVLAFGAISTVLGALLSPIGLVMVAVAALAAAWAADFGGIQEKTQSVFGAVQEAISTAMDFIVPKISGVLSIIQSLWITNHGLIQATANAVWEAIRTIIDVATSNIQAIIDSTLQTVRGWWDQNHALIQATTSTVWEAIRSLIEIATTAIQNIVNVTLGLILTWWNQNHELVRATAETVWGWIRGFIDTTLNAILSAVTAILTAIGNFWQDHGEQIKSIAQSAWDIIKTLIETTINVILGIIRTVMLLIQGDWEGAWNEIKAIGEVIWEGIKSVVESAINIVKNTVEIVLTTLQATWNTLWTDIKNKVSGIWDEIVSVVTSKVTDIKTNIVDGLNDAIAAITGMVGRFVDAGRAIISGMISGVIAKAGDLVNAAVQAATDALNAVKGWLGISCPDPSPVWAELGTGMAEGVRVGWERAFGGLQRAITADIGSLNGLSPRGPVLAPTYAAATSPITVGPEPLRGGGWGNVTVNVQTMEPAPIARQVELAMRRLSIQAQLEAVRG